MSVARNTGFGMAALAAGLLLAGPQAVGVASADDSGSQSTHSAGAARGTGGTAGSSGRNVKPANSTVLATRKPAAATRRPATAVPARAAAASAPVLTVPKAFRLPTVTGQLPNVAAELRTLIEGAALGVRRTLFDSAPTVNAVQTTGQVSGEIAGNLNVHDAEGNKTTVTILQSAQNGDVVLHSDGTYTYTPRSTFTGQDSFIIKVTDRGSGIDLAHPLRPKAVYVNVVVDQGTQIYPKFTFTYTTGALFWSGESKAALAWSATQLASTIAVTTPTTINLAVRGRMGFNEAGKKYDALASASSPRINDDDSGFYDTVVQDKIQTGVDANGKKADGEVVFNFVKPWGYGNTIGAKQYDFESVAMHELLHAMGWTDGFSKPGKNTGENWANYDQFISNSSGVEAINSNTYKFNTDLEPNITGKNGGLYFNGENAVAAYGGPVPIYTPDKYDGSSSIAHTDDETFNGTIKPRDLMNAEDPFGKGPRTLSGVDRGVLQDLGYTLAPLLVLM